MDKLMRHLMLTCLAAAGWGAWAAPSLGREVYVVTGRDAGLATAPDIARVESFWRERGTTALRVEAGALDDAPAVATASAESADRLIYYSGPIGRGDGGLVLADRSGPVAAAVPVESVLEAGADPRPTTLIINHCGTNMNISPRDFGFEGDWIVAYPVSSSCVPETVANRALAALAGPREGWVGALQAAGMMVARPLAPGSAPAGARRPGAPALQAVRNDSIVITTLRPSAPASPRIAARAPDGAGEIVTVSARPRDLAAALPAQGGTVQNPPASDTAPLVEGGGDRLVQPLRAGLPQPSIIVGEPALRADDVAAAPLPPRDAMGVSHELRATLRREDAAAFADLLEQGAFDPDADRMAAAIQTELFRMSCYASTVDGLWGRGSVTAVERYFAAANQRAPSTRPEVGLYRAIISGPDLTCPAPVAAPAAAQTRGNPAASGAGRGGANSRNQVERRNTPSNAGRRQPAANPPAAATPATPGRRTIAPNFGGSGMFR
ncbi:hypothetical protein [Paracoccus cavernae]|uniref:hypothetical protein n=1 Tax=Paracoccus cavernae TaxID=1571207 RepID=UPI0035F4A69C